jgi:hypothetical protein
MLRLHPTNGGLICRSFVVSNARAVEFSTWRLGVTLPTDRTIGVSGGCNEFFFRWLQSGGAG